LNQERQPHDKAGAPLFVFQTGQGGTRNRTKKDTAVADINAETAVGKPHVDSVTLLRCAENLRLAKLIRAGTFHAYDNCRTFDTDTAAVDGLAGVYALLGWALDQPRICAVRGSLIGCDKAAGVRRLVHPDQRTGERPTIEDMARNWLALDLDSVPLPAGTDARDLVRCGQRAVLQMPAVFHGVRCIVQATSGLGIKAGARLRLWYWLDRPTSCGEAKRWLRGAPVDRALFGAAQPIYTAAPLFDGALDHLPRRLAWLPGSDMVAVPSAESLAPPPAAAVGDYCGPITTGRLHGIIRRVVSAPVGERHALLFWGAVRLGEYVARGELAEDYALGVLVECGRVAGFQPPEKTVATALSGIAKGREAVAGVGSEFKYEGRV
jgi:hypothetical protein